MLNLRTKTENTKFEKFLTLLTFFAVFAGFAFAQTSTSGRNSTNTTVTPTATPVPPRTPRVYMPAPFPTPTRRTTPRRTMNTSGIPAEKSIAVDAKAEIQLCVNKGNLKVNGWNRDEVRAMVEDGSYVSFKVLNKTPQDKPNFLKVVGYDPVKGPGMDCLSGEVIELDVPHGATVKVTGFGYSAEVSSIYKVDIKTDNGNIVLNDIAQGITAQTYEGDLRVGDSGGEMTLVTTNGNIFAFNAKPIEFSNVFSARTTSGAIKLQSVEFPQINTKSTTGTIDFSGNILSGGQYDFYTQNGSILLNIPQQSSCAVTATYVSGNFQTDLTMTNVVKTPGQPQKLTGQIGTSSNATLKLSTLYGTINIKRKEP
jgi:hypothetical protein